MAAPQRKPQPSSPLDLPPTLTAPTTSAPTTSTSMNSSPPPGPVELDSHPISPPPPPTSTTTSTTTTSTTQTAPDRRRASSTCAQDDDAIYDDLSGETNMNRLQIEERAKRRAERSLDPAVVDEIAAEPAAEDFEVAAMLGVERRGKGGGGGVGVGEG